MSSLSGDVRRNYEVASLHAKLQAKTYENEMLKRLARHLVSSLSSGQDAGSQQQLYQYSYAHPAPAPSTKSTKARPRVQPADPMKWIPVEEEDNERGEPKKESRRQQRSSPLVFSKADFEDEEDVDFDGEVNYEDDEYYNGGTEEWRCGDDDGDDYPEGNGVSDRAVSDPEIEDDDGDGGGSGKVDERFLIRAFLEASGLDAEPEEEEEEEEEMDYVKPDHHSSKKKGERLERVEIATVVDRAAQLEGMRKLFGPAAAEGVLEAETEMQLHFDRFCGETGAEDWPCLPLNMKFDFD